MHRAIQTIAVALLVVIAGCAGLSNAPGADTGPTTDVGPGTDPGTPDSAVADPAPITPPPDAERDADSDPAYDADGDGSGDGAGGAADGDAGATMAQATGTPAPTESVGYSVGGAQDATAFRRNVEEGYVPQPTDVTYEGLFHDYYFDTGDPGDCAQLFCPAYSRAITADPLSNRTERFMTVGLNSNISQEAFERKDLNLVVVLDVSGSMSSSFDRYYYDDGEKKEVESSKTKMRAATDAVASMTKHLDEDDRLGLVTYQSHASVVQELTRVGELDRERFRTQLDGIRADGSTNLDAGMRTASEMVEPHANPDASERETRIIYVTDAMPNTGQTGTDPLGTRLSEMAHEGVYSTFVGVGVDFNSEIVESITSTRGANYYTVESPGQFDERMDEGFQYMVTPLVFDLELQVESEGYEIENVYGTTDEAASTGEILSVKTLFPSKTEGGRTKGGVVLLQLAKTGESPELTLSASYENREGEAFASNRTITFEDRPAPYYESSGVRKAVALQRYATLLRNWAAFERSQHYGVTPEEPDHVEDDIVVRDLGKWEQQSVDLGVSDLYAERFERFEAYFESQVDVLGEADAFQDDFDVLETLSEFDGGPTTVIPPEDDESTSREPAAD